jgi:ADP-ribose pyrophosphatase
MTTEATRVYLARGLTAVPDGERHVGVHEEADMPVSWAPLRDLVDGVLAGRMHNPLLVSGVLAAWAARHDGGFDALRPADAPWPARDSQP